MRGLAGDRNVFPCGARFPQGHPVQLPWRNRPSYQQKQQTSSWSLDGWLQRFLLYHFTRYRDVTGNTKLLIIQFSVASNKIVDVGEYLKVDMSYRHMPSPCDACVLTDITDGCIKSCLFLVLSFCSHPYLIYEFLPLLSHLIYTTLVISKLGWIISYLEKVFTGVHKCFPIDPLCDLNAPRQCVWCRLRDECPSICPLGNVITPAAEISVPEISG